MSSFYRYLSISYVILLLCVENLRKYCKLDSNTTLISTGYVLFYAIN